MRASPARALALLLPLAVLLAGCAEGLANAPSINRHWTAADFQGDVIANGPDSCPREGRDPLAPEGEMRRMCPDTTTRTPGNMPAMKK